MIIEIGQIEFLTKIPGNFEWALGGRVVTAFVAAKLFPFHAVGFSACQCGFGLENRSQIVPIFADSNSAVCV